MPAGRIGNRDPPLAGAMNRSILARLCIRFWTASKKGACACSGPKDALGYNCRVASMKAVPVRDPLRSRHRIQELSVLYLSAHPSCDCHCMMCDIWKGSGEKAEMSLRLLDEYLDGVARLKIQKVVLSGGEPLEHSEFPELCMRLKRRGLRSSSLQTQSC